MDLTPVPLLVIESTDARRTLGFPERRHVVFTPEYEETPIKTLGFRNQRMNVTPRKTQAWLPGHPDRACPGNIVNGCIWNTKRHEGDSG